MKITITSSSKSLTQNNDMNSSYFNRDFNRSKYINFPKQNKNLLYIPNNQSSKLASSFNNNTIIQKNVNIEEQLEQYKLHPYRRINFKILGEGIKQKLFEMEEEKLFDNEKLLSSREDYGNQITKTKMQEKYNIESKNNNKEETNKLNKSIFNDEIQNKKS